MSFEGNEDILGGVTDVAFHKLNFRRPQHEMDGLQRKKSTAVTNLVDVFFLLTFRYVRFHVNRSTSIATWNTLVGTVSFWLVP